MAAQQLEDAGPLRIAERLSREAEAERAFWKHYSETISRPLSDAAFLLEVARAEGAAILESPSFRDGLRVLIARRRGSKVADSEANQVAAALFAKWTEKHRPPGPSSFDEIKLERYEVFHAALRTAHREVPRDLVGEKEILLHLTERRFVLRPPPVRHPGDAPAGWWERYVGLFNQKNLLRVARHLSRYRCDPRGGGDLSQHAIELTLEGLSPDVRFGARPQRLQEPLSAPVAPLKAERELVRLRGVARRRRRRIPRT